MLLAINNMVKRSRERRHMNFVVQLIKSESKRHFYGDQQKDLHCHLVVYEDLRLNLLSKSCVAPGVVSLISNLITSSDQESGSSQEEWLKQYYIGSGHEIYRVAIPKIFENMRFSRVAAFIYSTFGCVLFALEVVINRRSQIILNPSSMRLTNISMNRMNGFLMCLDKKTADSVSNMECMGAEGEFGIDQEMVMFEDLMSVGQGAGQLQGRLMWMVNQCYINGILMVNQGHRMAEK